MPITIEQINWAYKQVVDVNQLWAQITHEYQNGGSPELTPAERAALADVHKQHEVENPLQTYVTMYFRVEPSNADMRCSTADIILRLQSFCIRLHNNPKSAGREINDALAPLGLKREYMSISGVKAWGWRGIEPNDERPPHPHGGNPNELVRVKGL